MVQRLRYLLGRVDNRVLFILTGVLVVAGSLFTLAQLVQSTSVSVPTVSTWNDLAKEYLAARERDCPLVVPTGFEEELTDIEQLQAQPDWYWTFDTGTFYFDAKSQIGKQLKKETQLVIYEDMINEELLILQEMSNGTFQEAIVYKAPAWPESADYSAELAKRRIVWNLTLKPKSLAAKELVQTEELQLLSTDSGISVMRMMMFENEDYTNHLWLSVRGPGQGYADGAELSVHIPADFTNKLEVFACTNLTEQNWYLAVTNLTTVGTDVVVWSDSEFTNLENGYYTVASAETDSDRDGITDGKERYLHKTRYQFQDTDNDGMSDDWESINGLNPFEDDADLDNDLDGFSNVEEYNATPATCPTNPLSASPAVYVAVNGTDSGDGSYTNPYYSISEGISGATDGMRVVVLPGVYTGAANWALSLQGKKITVKGAKGPEETIVDCQGGLTAFIFDSGESSNTVLSGMTIKHAGFMAIFVDSQIGDVVVEDCIITECEGLGDGVAVYVGTYATPVLRNCVIWDNASSYTQGMICCTYASAPKIQNCTIVNNIGKGIDADSESFVEVRNSIVYGNAGGNWTDNPTNSIEYSCIPNAAGEGNITNEPALASYGYRLKAVSPCIDAGDGSNAPVFDIHGERRWDDPAHTNRVSIADMGADEFRDTDGDSLADDWEKGFFGGMGRDGSADMDADGLSDLEEYEYGTNPNRMDTDEDGLSDGAEVHTHRTNPLKMDSDKDGLPDKWEVDYGLNPLLNDAYTDLDGDGLRNRDEYYYGTDPSKTDTDDDGLNDISEVRTHHTNPLDSDTDDDGFSDSEEVNELQTDPTNYSDGAEMIEEMRQRLSANWSLIYQSPLVFTNPPGSTKDLNDIRTALSTLSGQFYEAEEE